MKERERLAAFYRSWEGKIDQPDAHVFERDSIVAMLPRAVAERYPELDQDALDDFSFACLLFSMSVVRADDIMDYVTTLPYEVKVTIPQLFGLLAESYRIYGNLFPADRPFWKHMHVYLAEFIDAMTKEVAFARPGVDWTALSEDDCIVLARQKLGLVKIVAAGVCELAEDYEHLAALEDMLVGAFLANQMSDDLQDWREDIRDGNISLLLRRCCASRQDLDDPRLIAQRLFLEGHADRTLELSEQIAREASEQAQRLKLSRLAAILDGQQRQARALRVTISEEIDRQQHAAPLQSVQ